MAMALSPNSTFSIASPTTKQKSSNPNSSSTTSSQNHSRRLSSSMKSFPSLEAEDTGILSSTSSSTPTGHPPLPSAMKKSKDKSRAINISFSGGTLQNPPRRNSVGFKNLDTQNSDSNNVSLSSTSSNELSTSLTSNASSDFSLPAMGHSLNTSSLSAYSDLPSFIAPPNVPSTQTTTRLQNLESKMTSSGFNQILAPLLQSGWSTGSNSRHTLLYFSPKHSETRLGTAKKNHFTADQKCDLLLTVAKSDKYYHVVFPEEPSPVKHEEEEEEVRY